MRSELDTPIHVVAGVLRDIRGRVLLARRTAGRDLAGAWEFPGGKVEPDELVREALERELFEELGIRIGDTRPLIRVPQQYNDKSIVLDVYSVATYSGTPKGRENQALVWTPLEKLITYPMPPADKPVVAALTKPEILAVTPDFDGDREKFLTCIEGQLASGIRLIQLRCASLGAEQLKELALDIRKMCFDHNAILVINQEISLAKTLKCPVHLKSYQLMQTDIQQQLAGNAFSAACHNVEQLKRAESLAADFVLLGPIFETPSHPGTDGIGWQEFFKMRNLVSLPIFAIGGLGKSDFDHARQHGAQGIAGISQFWPD